jgi:hypothetical protein
VDTHVKVLAVLHIVLGALGILAAFFVLLIFGAAGAATVAGIDGNSDAAIALPLIGLTGTALFVFLMALSLPGIVAGIGLLKYRPWARILTIVLCAINLVNIPFGTALGAYGLWVLLSDAGARLFVAQPVVSSF